jgi:hypothetical protein
MVADVTLLMKASAHQGERGNGRRRGCSWRGSIQDRRSQARDARAFANTEAALRTLAARCRPLARAAPPPRADWLFDVVPLQEMHGPGAKHDKSNASGVQSYVVKPSEHSGGFTDKHSRWQTWSSWYICLCSLRLICQQKFRTSRCFHQWQIEHYRAVC